MTIGKRGGKRNSTHVRDLVVDEEHGPKIGALADALAYLTHQLISILRFYGVGGGGVSS